MTLSASRRPAVPFVCVTLALFTLGFGIIIPVLPGLVTRFDGGSVAAGSNSYGSLVGVFALMQFVFSPILGSLSDRFGRRPVLLIALCGLAVDYIIMGLAPNLKWLFVGRMISGATAGALATCNAYIADITPPERRAQSYGLLGAAFGVGFIVGPAMGGWLGQIHLRLPFFGAAGCILLNVIYGLFVLPESLPAERRRRFDWKRANPVGGLAALRRFRGVLVLAAMYFVFTFANSMLQSIWVLYTGYRYHWTTAEVGTSLAVVGVAMALVQAVMVRPILGRIGERTGLLLGLAISAASMFGYGRATHGWMIYAILVVGSFGGIAGPAAQSIMTRRVAATEQGELQGGLASLGSLAYIFAPLLAAWSFGTAVAAQAWLGIAFYEAAALLLVALALAAAAVCTADLRPCPAAATA